MGITSEYRRGPGPLTRTCWIPRSPFRIQENPSPARKNPQSHHTNPVGAGAGGDGGGDWRDYDEAAASADVVTHKSRNAGPADKLSFDRVAMSKKIKLVLEQILPLCDRVSELLKINPPHANNTAIGSLKRPLIGSTTTQDTLYGRQDLFEKTIKDIITSAANSREKLSVLPIVGPGGIGKTTFTQHLYNDKRIDEHFSVRVWICVSTDFDVLKISQQILSCIEGSNNANQTTSLDQLQISIAQNLKSKRFLIVFDDIWECTDQSWENLLAPFMKGEAKAKMVKSINPIPLEAFWHCWGLPSLPQGLHSLSSLTELYVSTSPEIRSLPKGGLPASLTKLYLRGCPQIRSLPEEGLPTSLRELFVYSCSPELQEQAKELQGTKPDLQVYA
ncbi:hypothetical protein BRADI_1g29634v3 [Brachypodium distachyon]|uniref:NB-ARC domain-containing protein n=1 Tax=Brachypodium distachyon TaxID=15368 RepID=A0A0Q3KZT6_BRADI|nr:hypothetical protein BRADI_1g29634v3 [Brachypodium distachyon]